MVSSIRRNTHKIKHHQNVTLQIHCLQIALITNTTPPKCYITDTLSSNCFGNKYKSFNKSNFLHWPAMTLVNLNLPSDHNMTSFSYLWYIVLKESFWNRYTTKYLQVIHPDHGNACTQF